MRVLSYNIIWKFPLLSALELMISGREGSYLKGGLNRRSFKNIF